MNSVNCKAMFLIIAHFKANTLAYPGVYRPERGNFCEFCSETWNLVPESNAEFKNVPSFKCDRRCYLVRFDFPQPLAEQMFWKKYQSYFHGLTDQWGVGIVGWHPSSKDFSLCIFRESNSAVLQLRRHIGYKYCETKKHEFRTLEISLIKFYNIMSTLDCHRWVQV